MRKSSIVILSEDAMILRLTTVHEKGLDSRFRGNDNNCVIPAKAGIHCCCVGLFSWQRRIWPCRWKSLIVEAKQSEIPRCARNDTRTL